MIISTEFYEFFALVCREIDRADAKHGDWQGKSPDEMSRLMRGEVLEVNRAAVLGDAHGPHGILAELPQVACTAFKFWREVRRAEAERTGAGADAIDGGGRAAVADVYAQQGDDQGCSCQRVDIVCAGDAGGAE